MLTAIYILALLILIVLSAFFAGSETGVYRLSRFNLRLDIEQSRPFAKTLKRLTTDSHSLVFSILIGNNLVNCLATSIFTVMVLNSSFADNTELLVTLILTPILFVFGEVLPKTIYYDHANPLMTRLAPLLMLFHKIFTYSGLIWLLRSFSRILSTLLPVPDNASDAISTSRTHISRIIRETREEGMLTAVQNDIMNRLMNIPSITVGSVMTPASKVQMLDINSNRKQVLDKLRNHKYTRLPVYEKRKTHIVGYVNIYEVLEDDKDFTSLKSFLKPLGSFTPRIRIIEAINTMQRENHKLVLIATHSSHKHKSRQHPLGIITMKDLAEELTGELQQW